MSHSHSHSLSPVSHWDTINGSPNRQWRYMTDISDPTYHWWQHANPFIVIPTTAHNNYRYIVYSATFTRLTPTTTYRTLRECQRAALQHITRATT